MIKQLRMAVMKRSKLHNDFLKNRNDASKNIYKRQWNLCVNLSRNVKEHSLSNVNLLLMTKKIGNKFNHSSLKIRCQRNNKSDEEL